MGEATWTLIFAGVAALAALANFVWLVWRHYATPPPPIIWRVEPNGRAEEPNLFLATVQPIPDHEAIFDSIEGRGVVLARTEKGAGPSYEPGPFRPGSFGPTARYGIRMPVNRPGEVRVQFFASPAPSGWVRRLSSRFQKSSSIKARIILISPRRRIITSTMPIRVRPIPPKT